MINMINLLLDSGSPLLIFFIVTLIVDVTLNLYILYYLGQLGDVQCTCAMNWQRDFIKLYVMCSCVISIVSLAFWHSTREA